MLEPVEADELPFIPFVPPEEFVEFIEPVEERVPDDVDEFVIERLSVPVDELPVAPGAVCGLVLLMPLVVEVVPEFVPPLVLPVPPCDMPLAFEPVVPEPLLLPLLPLCANAAPPAMPSTATAGRRNLENWFIIVSRECVVTRSRDVAFCGNRGAASAGRRRVGPVASKSRNP